jgi:hypothetical protein
MSNTSSIDLKEVRDAELEQSFRPTLFAKLKKHVKNIKAEWGPGLAAKESWDDEYNFPAGRYASQGIELGKL